MYICTIKINKWNKSNKTKSNKIFYNNYTTILVNHTIYDNNFLKNLKLLPI